MASYESSYKSLLQGVSQQIPSARQDGQLTQQVNMLSDTTTNLRRRTGSPVLFQHSGLGANENPENFACWNAEVDGEQFHFRVDGLNFTLRVFDNAGAQVAEQVSGYYQTTNSRTIQYASVDGQVFIANTLKKPTFGSSSGLKDPAKCGFVHVVAGAFTTRYSVTLNNGGTITAYAYDTPSGTATGDAEKALPSYICAQLAALIVIPGLTVTAYQDTIFFQTTASVLTLSTATGQALMVATGASTLREEDQLPADLGIAGDGYIVKVGSGRAYRYYIWKPLQKTWLESAAYGQDATIGDVPIQVSRVGGVWTFTNFFEGRLAGDTETNPDPEFTRRGVTGLASYQGRLVILAGSRVCLSSSANPRRFYRSTVVDLLDVDTISIGSSAANSAKWEQATQYDKDLLVFSSKYQAVIPGANTAITPRTASITVFSTYDTDTTTRPIGMGRTLLYPSIRSKNYFGALELAPTGNADSSYASYDITAHIPTYLKGRCRFAMSSTGGTSAILGTTGNLKELIVHEYTWSGNDKVQQAWHRWEFPYPVVSAYFANNVIVVVLYANSRLTYLSLDPKAPTIDAGTFSAPLDLAVTQAVVAGAITPSAAYATMLGEDITSVVGCVATGPRISEPVQLVWDGAKWMTPYASTGDLITYGLPFTSTVEPTPPIKRDANGVKVSSNKFTVLRFMLGTNASRQFNVQVSDGNSDEPYTLEQSPLYWSSDELQLDEARVAGADAVVIIPCRTVADSTRLIISTDGTGELNITSLEYVVHYKEKIQRQRF